MRDGVTVVASRTLLKACELYLGRTIDRLGDQYTEQTSGVPIGGYLSSALLDAHMTCTENICDRALWKRHAQSAVSDLCRDQVVAGF
eukprot:5212004-Karenia_brevis.AAC.1